MDKEITFCILKPDVVKQGLAFQILGELEDLGFEVLKMQKYEFSEEAIDSFYGEHVEKDFYPLHKKFMTSGATYAVLLRGLDAVKSLRLLIGNYQPLDAGAGTIRGKYGTIAPANAIHASDSEKSAEREAEFFGWRKQNYDG